MKRLLSALILVAMVAALAVACNGANEAAETTANSTTDPVTEALTEAVTTVADDQHDLPSGLRFDGETLILATYEGGNVGPNWSGYLDVDEPTPGNLIEEAAYARNEEVENLLGITVTCQSDWMWLNGLTVALDVCTRSGTSIYDVMFLESIFSYESLIIDELIKDVETIPYMDLSKSYYNQKFNETYYLRDNLYLFTSDISFPNQSGVQWLVNDDRLRDLGYAEDFLFQKVEAGEWNLPLVWDMIEGLHVDVNNDGVDDLTDIYGIGGDCWQLAPLYPAAGLKGCYYTEDGFAFDYGTDYSYEVFNEIIELQRSPDVKFSGEEDAWFVGNALFTVSGKPIRLLQPLEFDLSVLPMPRFNENQDRYYNFVSGGVTIIPATIKDETLVGASVEAMAWSSAKHMVPAFHDSFIEEGVLRNQESWNNWNRMLSDWAAPEFCYLIAPDGRLTWFKPVYECLWFDDPSYPTKWDAMKASVEETCWIFFEFYLADLGA
jgi:hypothetical protein